MSEEQAEHGTLKTSTILIGAGKRLSVYRKLEEVPAGLRSKLVKSTAGANAGTVLIADRRGAEELLRANTRTVPDDETNRLRAAAAVLGEDLRLILRFLQTYWWGCGPAILAAALIWWLVAAGRH
jgi:hypothetical protein